jgi:RNA polymerase sigma factor (sigma-70 family)
VKLFRPPVHREGTFAVSTKLLPLPAAADDQAVDIDALFRAQAATVARWARRLGGPRVEADDVVQEVFLQAKRKLVRWEARAKITTWLFRATEKIARRARRRQQLRELWQRTFGAGVEATAPGGTPLEGLEREETCRRVYAILDRLPEQQRAAVILFELEGMSTQEIAELLGAHLPTVRVWLHRGRARFAELAEATLLADETERNTRP